ncbi:RNase LS family HEPN domain-containing protein [Saccharibacillus brassicae]|nr:RNase LS family HEPN domain-containing protein [Saccharibacillus brassicae]
MAKNKGYFLNKIGLESVVNNFCNIEKSECLNPANQQTRYFLEKEDKKFSIDVFFRKDNTITITPLPNQEFIGIATELHGLIRDSVEYKNVVSGTFSTKLLPNQFTDLKQFIEGLSGVTVLSEEDKGLNGKIIKYKTDFGDSVTLTYYNSTHKLFFQGLMMNLYIIIKTYLAPFNGNAIPTKISGSTGASIEELADQYIKHNLPNGFKYLDPIMANFITDSFTLVAAGTNLRDYAAWVMPTMRVLEHSIKRICLNSSIYLEDKGGFRYFNGNGSKTSPVFQDHNGSQVVNTDLQSRLDSDRVDILVRCYLYLKSNRHELFHTTQIVQGTRLVSTPEEAQNIIIGACDLIEESLKFDLNP